MNLLRSPWITATGLALALIGSALSVSKRVTIESANSQVLMVAEGDVVSGLSVSQGKVFSDGLKSLATNGLGGVVLAEQTIGELISEGKASLVSSTNLDAGRRDPSLSLKINDPTILNRVQRGLAIRFGTLVKTTSPRGDLLALPPVDAETVRSTAVGLDPLVSAEIKKAGLVLLARASNPMGVTSKGVEATVAWLKESGAAVFLPQGDQVLGRRESLDATVASLRKNNMLYASPEFTKLGGDTEMLLAAPDLVVRLHSAQALELDKLSPAGAIERYSKAAKERNMRILLMRPLSFSADQPLDSFGEFLSALGRELQSSGLKSGMPVPFEDPTVPAFARILIGLGGAIVTFSVAVALVSGVAGIGIGSLLGLVCLVGGVTHGSLSGLGALVITLSMPVVGFLLIEQLKPKLAILAVLLVVVTSLIGGLCVAGLLNDALYFIRAKAFPGVKLAVFAPILAIGWFWFKELCDSKQALKSPITWGSAMLGLLIVGVLAFMVIRSGNDAPAGVSGGELQFRGFLEAILPVRPRTKEFLIGFPALILGCSWLIRAKYDREALGSYAGWVALLIMLGGIAATDVVNTLCHLHTPVVLSLIRVGLGLAFGCLIGGGAWLVLSPIVNRLQVKES